MLSHLNEQMLVEQIEQQQQKLEIESLFKKRKKLTTGLIKDPVYNQLYVDWESGTGRKRRNKTQVNLSSHFSQSRLNQKKSQIVPNHQKKYYSQSVQLPKISKKLNVKTAMAEQGRNSDFSGYKFNQASMQNPRSLRKSGVRNVVWSSYQTKHNTINSEQQQKKKQISGKLNPYEKITSKRFKLSKMNEKNKNKSKQIKREWLELDILKLQTYFIKLKRNKQQQAAQKVEMQNPDEPKRQQLINFPSKQKIPDFIRSYKITNPLIDVNELIKRPDFKIIYDQGESLYFGETGENSKTKVGIIATKNSRFEGIWRNGHKSEGYEITAHGYYKGHFKQDKRHGQGQFHWKNGQVYSGQWVKGVKHGSGMWKSGKGDTYIGQWKNGKVQGLGVHTSANGQRYEGQFQGFLKEGKGKENFPNGDTYEGQYRKGKPHGKGKYIWKNQIIYEGSFIDGYRHGKGKITAKNYVKFSGNFQRQKVMGFGELVYDNGDRYQGQFYKGQKEGKGIMKLHNQKKILSGMWKNNNFNFEQEQVI